MGNLVLRAISHRSEKKTQLHTHIAKQYLFDKYYKRCCAYSSQKGKNGVGASDVIKSVAVYLHDMKAHN